MAGTVEAEVSEENLGFPPNRSPAWRAAEWRPEPSGERRSNHTGSNLKRFTFSMFVPSMRIRRVESFLLGEWRSPSL